MKKNIAGFALALVLFAAPVVAVFAQANAASSVESPLLGKLKTVGKGAGYDTASNSDVFSTVGTLISVALGLLGMIFIILILVAGFNWMTAAGDEEKIKKAGSMIRAAVIGLLIVVSAFAIWTFISTMILRDTPSAFINLISYV